EDTWGGDLVTAAVSHLAASTRARTLFTVSFMNDWTNEHVAGYEPRSSGRRPPAPGWGSRWIWAGWGRHSGALRNDVSGPPSLSLREVADRAGVAMSSVSR